jgi:uncharacterized protein with FMN-binding domain
MMGAVAAVLLFAAAAWADELELTSGKSYVEETAEFVTIRVTRGGGSATMKFPVRDVRAVTVAGQRRELAAAPSAAPSAAGPARTRAEIDALINAAGQTPPDWWDSAPADYPQTLRLTWAKPEGPWDPQRNLGQYLWSIVDANPDKAPGAAKLFHHMLTLHKDNPAELQQTMLQLGHVYADLLADYARAAFWLRKAEAAGKGLALPWQVKLASCYWKLGAKEMAVESLSRLTTFDGGVVKLWSDMGELDRAIALAEALARQYPDLGYLLAGEAYQFHGRYQEAEASYQKVLAATQGTGRVERNKEYARANLEALKAVAGLDISRVPDGTYRGGSLGFKGPVNVDVTVANGRIESVRIADHREDRALSALVVIPKGIVEKQGVRDIDAVTGATVTSHAVLNATAKALTGAAH